MQDGSTELRIRFRYAAWCHPPCSELSRLGRNAFEVLETVKELVDSGINLYLQKEQMVLLGDDGKPSIFAPIMLATLSTCAQLERDNIAFRLNSGRKQYVANGGKLGRPSGSTKSQDKKREEYIESSTSLIRAMPSVMWRNSRGKV